MAELVGTGLRGAGPGGALRGLWNRRGHRVLIKLVELPKFTAITRYVPTRRTVMSKLSPGLWGRPQRAGAASSVRAPRRACGRRVERAGTAPKVPSRCVLRPIRTGTARSTHPTHARRRYRTFAGPAAHSEARPTAWFPRRCSG